MRPKLNAGVSRRRLLSRLGLLATAGPLSLLAPPWVDAETDLSSVREWRRTFKGVIVERGNKHYELWRSSMPWQFYKAPRYPELIVRPHSATEVAEAVRFAARQRMKVTTKSGGHSVPGAFLRDGGMLLDLSEFRGAEFDSKTGIAQVEPALWGRNLLQKLAPYRRAFPSAHCATVPLGGYILGGGLGHNHDSWGGMACHTIAAAEIITPEGQKILATPQQHADWYWAVRGAGTGFFGVVTRYHVRTYALPRALHTATYLFPLSRLDQVLLWFEQINRERVDNLELMILVARNPAAKSNDPKERSICVARAVAFADSEKDARTTLAPLLDHPLAQESVAKFEMQPTDFETLSVESVDPARGFGFGRYGVDAVWMNEPRPALAELVDHFIQAPSPKAHLVISFKHNQTLHDDAAFSRIGNCFVGCYAVWEREDQDAANFAWLKEESEILRRHAVGHYINETDGFAAPENIPASFSADAWERLKTLRRDYDPKGVFHDYHGLS